MSNRVWGKRVPLMLGALAGATLQDAAAESFDFFGLDGSYNMQAAYSAAFRTQKADDRIINAPPAESIPLPDYMKVPESNNYDDGDRNFDRGALINNRLTLLGEVQLEKNDYGLLLRGDAFYDDVYHRRNDNNNAQSRQTINKTDGDVNEEPTGPTDEFTSDAEYYDGQRARLLDAYVYGSWYVGDSGAVNLRVGRHIAAWGESLFFSGIALAQSPADATKAAIPGADVKSILLPVTQVSAQYSFADKWTLLGQYKLQYKPTELFPAGEFFSPADVIGPGAQFIYGIKNPARADTYEGFNPSIENSAELLDLINRAGPNLPASAGLDVLNAVGSQLDPTVPDVALPTGSVPQPGAPKYINVRRERDLLPSDHGQYGLGAKYQITPTTNAGLYHLRYHNTTPAPVQNYGDATLQYGPDGTTPVLTTSAFGVVVPVTYNVKYFDGVRMTALSSSTNLFGANVGFEAIYRDGIDVLVDIPSSVLGPVPTPTRAKVMQYDLNSLYLWGPRWFWDSLVLVSDIGYMHVLSVDEACDPNNSCSKKLTNTKDSSAVNFLALIDRKNVFNGWDLNMPVTFSTMLSGHAAVAGGFGPLAGEHDHRASIGANFTYLQKLTLGTTYAWYFGEPHFAENPYADRDNVGFTIKYAF